MKRILIVENSPTLRQMLLEIVESQGHQSQTASTAGEAMGKVLEWRPDAVILDLQLDEGSRGESVYKRLRSDPLMKNMPVIACTVQRQATLIRSLGPETAPADPKLFTLFKPFSLQQVTDVLSRALAG